MNSIKELDLSALNQLFLQMSREFREEIRKGKPPEQLCQLQSYLYNVHEELKSRRFRYRT